MIFATSSRMIYFFIRAFVAIWL